MWWALPHFYHIPWACTQTSFCMQSILWMKYETSSLFIARRPGCSVDTGWADLSGAKAKQPALLTSSKLPSRAKDQDRIPSGHRELWSHQSSLVGSLQMLPELQKHQAIRRQNPFQHCSTSAQIQHKSCLPLALAMACFFPCLLSAVLAPPSASITHFPTCHLLCGNFAPCETFLRRFNSAMTPWRISEGRENKQFCLSTRSPELMARDLKEWAASLQRTVSPGQHLHLVLHGPGTQDWS